MTLDAHSGGAPIGYRRILQSRVDEFRARVTRENREMFAADRRRRRDATESLHVHVKTLIEDEFRAERLRSAREDERARAREVADRRSAVEQALVVETQRRLEVAREGLSARRALLDATRRDTGARAQATREYLNDEEEVRLACARREHEARARELSRLRDDVTTLRDATVDALDVYARRHRARARADLRARREYLLENERDVDAQLTRAREIVRALDDETRAACATTRREREAELHDVYAWVYDFTGRRIRPTL